MDTEKRDELSNINFSKLMIWSHEKKTGKKMLPVIFNETVTWCEVSEEIYYFYIKSLAREERAYHRNYLPQSVKNDGTKPEEQTNPEKKVCMPRCVSYDGIVENGGEGHLVSTPDPAEEIMEKVDIERDLKFLRKAMENLTDEEWRIYRHFYVEQKNACEYERTYGIGRKTVRYQEARMLRRMKAYLKELKKFEKN